MMVAESCMGDCMSYIEFGLFVFLIDNSDGSMYFDSFCLIGVI